MKRWGCPLVVLGLVCWAQHAGAQEPYGVPGQVLYPHTQTAPPTVTPPTQVSAPPYTPPQWPPLQANPEDPRPARNTLQRFGVGCWSHLSLPACGSLRSELAFAFGSCRTFFGEACKHGPPSVPTPAGYGPPSVAPWGPLHSAVPLGYYGPATDVRP